MQILKELEVLIPPLTIEEFKQLERNILEEGIRDPLVTWNGILVDGHNRYRIATEHDMNYITVEKEFTDMNAVKEWMIYNQFGRRNLPTYERGKLALRLKDIFREKAKDNLKIYGGNQYDAPCQKSDNIQKIDTKKELAKIANVSHDTINKIENIEAKASNEVKQKLSSGTMSINEAYKEIKKEEVELKRKEIRDTFEKQDVEVKDKKYRIIYADPPWKYGNSMPLGTTEPQDYYLLMDTMDICAMPIKDITEKDAVLFLWSTSPHLPEALEVAKAWGFTYKTTFIWDKIKHNMGHYNSVRHEILLVCTKGACTPDVKRLFDSVVSEERTEHSKKPNVFREIIETIYTYGNKIELFARESPEGWDVFGNQTNK
jgi:N6-adenosine-specific RNA methylase IME4/DNA-binding XRE family transcriptional regulator